MGHHSSDTGEYIPSEIERAQMDHESEVADETLRSAMLIMEGRKNAEG